MQLDMNRDMSGDTSGKQERLIIREELSIESLFVSFVFFVVLSQFLVTGRFEFISQPFRPLIIIILALQVVRRGRLRLPVCKVALAMSVYQMAVWFFLYPKGGPIRLYLVAVLYFMMLFSVGGFPWNRKEIQMIIYASFLATFVCAVVFFFSNNMLDFSDHDLRFMGVFVNRNKNAYTFALGIILGRSYLAFGRGRNRLIVFLMIVFEGYCLLYSKCRGAFIGVFITACIVALFRVIRMQRDNNPYLVFYVLFFITACIAGYFLIKYSAFSRLVDSENLSGRDDGIQHAWQLFRQAPLLGKIFGNGLLYESQHTEGIGVHLAYLSYLLEAGIVGALLLVMIFFTAVKNIHGEIQWTLFILAFSRTFFEGMDYYIFIPLILAICVSNYVRLYDSPGSRLFERG